MNQAARIQSKSSRAHVRFEQRTAGIQARDQDYT